MSRYRIGLMNQLERPGDDERVDREVEARVHHHQEQPGQPSNVREHACHVAEEGEPLPGRGAVQAVVQKQETRGRDREKDQLPQRFRGTVRVSERRIRSRLAHLGL